MSAPVGGVCPVGLPTRSRQASTGRSRDVRLQLLEALLVGLKRSARSSRTDCLGLIDVLDGLQHDNASLQRNCQGSEFEVGAELVGVLDAGERFRGVQRPRQPCLGECGRGGPAAATGGGQSAASAWPIACTAESNPSDTPSFPWSSRMAVALSIRRGSRRGCCARHRSLS